MKKFLKENWDIIAVIILALFLRHYRIVGINFVEGQSMYPTLKEGQVTIGSSIKNLERGDIVIADVGKLVVKRVVGMPGETVECHDGSVYINGEILDESYVKDENNVTSSEMEWSFTLGENEYLILGDNRDSSRDSRSYGPVDEEQIVEKVYIEL